MAKAAVRQDDSLAANSTEKRLRALERGGASPQQVMKALAEAGIRDLDELVRRVIGREKADPQPIDPTPAVRKTSGGRDPAAKRKPPKIAFTIASTTYDPKDIDRFEDQALCMVPRSSSRGEPELLAFTGSDWLATVRDYFRLVNVGSQPALAHLHPATSYGAGGGYDPYVPHGPGTPGWHPAGVNPGTQVMSLLCRFYVDPSFRGDQFWLGANSQVADLRKFSRGAFGLGDWNDVISSLQTEGATCVLYTDINFQDHDSLIVMPTEIYAHLGLFGWDDRVSSMQNFGAIY